jgi:hypothetical protein
MEPQGAGVDATEGASGCHVSSSMISTDRVIFAVFSNMTDAEQYFSCET